MNDAIEQTGPLDAVIEKGILFLLIFTPLAVGTVQQWSIAVMEIAAFSVFFAWLLKALRTAASSPSANLIELHAPNAWLALFPLVFAVFILCQLIPLPPGALRFLSPNTAAHYRFFVDDPPGVWRPLSLYPQATMDELLKFLSYAAIFVVIISHYESPEKLKRLFRTIIIMGCCLVLFAVLQLMTWNGDLYWVFQVKTLVKGVPVFGPYINKNHFAGYMEMAAPLAFGSYLHALTKMSGTSEMKDKPFPKKIAAFLGKRSLHPVALALIPALLLSGALFMTLSKGAVLGYGAAMLFLIALARSRRSLRKHGIFILVTGGVLFWAIVVSGWAPLEKRLEELGETGSARFEIWKDAAALIRDYPLAGTGLGTFQSVFTRYQTAGARVRFEHAENEYVELLAELGLIGSATALAGAGFFFLALYKRWRKRHNGFVVSTAAGGMAAGVAIMIHGFSDFNTRVPANALLMTVIAAGTYAALFRVRGGKHSHDEAT